jgi:hypothetical protein
MHFILWWPPTTRHPAADAWLSASRALATMGLLTQFVLCVVCVWGVPLMSCLCCIVAL